MIAMIVQVTVKVGMEAEFLRLAEDDALHSEGDEPGCLRFDVLRDQHDPRRYYFYEVYVDEAARLSHMNQPHLKRIDERIPELFDSASIHMADSVFPAGAAFRR
jgi:autoinducer 2-degrading protein